MKIGEFQIPKGTIDVQARIKLTGSGDKISVSPGPSETVPIDYRLGIYRDVRW
ncbi:MAG: hypothetical protein JSS77_10730 [Acidobacteria bacterium]|nr:hypothetical protein [Acidobacteriota bacterium]